MENFRSKSTRDGRLQMEIYNDGGGSSGGGPPNMKDIRSYSTSYAYTSSSSSDTGYNKEEKMKKSKSRVSAMGSFGSKSGSWKSLNDPELQRKKRVVGYKVYSVEGKMKGSLRKSFRWIKNTCTQVVYGNWW
ncbi:unnamed protein product [Cuscuta epithymum]|uniref:DUF3511 domain protein n=1 Tax=Cuscuta epithymum TaxID=186058 RepID=A0AAV0CVL9_9ASTE|nr:unnamed protein product [Cuscuta epithymum]